MSKLPFEVLVVLALLVEVKTKATGSGSNPGQRTLWKSYPKLYGAVNTLFRLYPSAATEVSSGEACLIPTGNTVSHVIYNTISQVTYLCSPSASQVVEDDEQKSKLDVPY